MSTPRILFAVLIFIAIGGYRLITYEKMAYEIRKEDAAMKKEATRIGLEKAGVATTGN